MRLIDLFGSQINEMASFNMYRKANDSIAFFANRRIGVPTTIVLPHYGTLEQATTYTVVTLRPKVGNELFSKIMKMVNYEGRFQNPQEELFATLWGTLIPAAGKSGFAPSMKGILQATNKLAPFPNVFKVVEVPDKAKLFQMLTTMGMPQNAFEEWFGGAPQEAVEHGMDLHGATVYFPDNIRPKRKEMLIGFLDRAYQTLASHGLGHIFAGAITFAPLKKSRAGDWHEKTQQMRVSPNTKNDMSNFYTLIHEYGHKYMDLFMEPGVLSTVQNKWVEVHDAGHKHERTKRVVDHVVKTANALTNVGLEAEYIGRRKGQKGRWKVTDVEMRFNAKSGRAYKHFIAEKLPEKGEYVVRPMKIGGPGVVFLDHNDWKLLNVDTSGLPTLDDANELKGTYETDEWFPTSYSEEKFVEWWAELFAFHMLGQLRGEPAEWMNTILPSSRVGESIVEQYDWDDEWQPETIELPAGTVLFHGTQAPMDFWDEREYSPDGPFWLSDQKEVAARFSTYNRFEGEMIPRVITYKTARPLRMLLIQSQEDKNNLEEYWGIDTFSTTDMAEGVCDKGFDGWIIPGNYQPGDDVMVCDGDAVEYQGTEPLKKASVGGWEGQTL